MEGLWEKSGGKKIQHEKEIWHFREGGGEELFIPRFGCVPGCLALIPTASCFVLFFVLPPDWLDPGAAFSLPDPNFPILSHHGTTRCLQLAEKGAEECYTCHMQLLYSPSPVLWIRLEFGAAHKCWPLLACHLPESWRPGWGALFFPSAQAPELLWKSLSGNWTHFFVPVEVGRDWKHSLRDNRLSQTPMTPPCSSHTWIRQQQVTQQLLQRFACRRTLSMISQPEFSATPLCPTLNVIWWAVSGWQPHQVRIKNAHLMFTGKTPILKMLLGVKFSL